MHLSAEQQTILDYLVSDASADNLTMISAVSGSGKTTMLKAIATTLKPTSGLYLAYNKSVADEAQSKFPKSVVCLTTHALAYKNTVKQFKLKLGQFTYRSISESITYDNKQALVNHIRAFCLSAHTSFSSYAESAFLSPQEVKLATKYLGLMQAGSIECSHDFYLKLFHILLATEAITYKPFDILFLDEAGDLNEVTLEIFKLIPAVRKVMVGDPFQNVYAFNHTINCFSVMHGKGRLFPMSQSFRVESSIAKSVEQFCQKYIDPSFHFQGVSYEPIPEVRTRAYISRTNSALIAKMVELNQLGIQYGLTRTAKQIFELPLALCSLKYQGFFANPEYKHIQDDVDHYFESDTLRQEFRTPLMYIKHAHSNDIALQTAIKAVITYGPDKLITCYKEALKHEKVYQSYMLGTSHSCKGLEFDEVTLAPDINDAVIEAINLISYSGKTYETLPIEHQSELNLYYVACTRARYRLNDAAHL